MKMSATIKFTNLLQLQSELNALEERGIALKNITSKSKIELHYEAEKDGGLNSDETATGWFTILDIPF